MTNFFFRKGDLIKYTRVDYFATLGGDVGSNTEDEMGVFMGFTSAQDMETCEIYTFCDNKITTVSVHNLILLSKNEK